MTNVTCTCTDEWFINAAEICVTSSCNVTDALSMAPREEKHVKKAQVTAL